MKNLSSSADPSTQHPVGYGEILGLCKFPPGLKVTGLTASYENLLQSVTEQLWLGAKVSRLISWLISWACHLPPASVGQKLATEPLFTHCHTTNSLCNWLFNKYRSSPILITYLSPWHDMGWQFGPSQTPGVYLGYTWVNIISLRETFSVFSVF